MYNWLRNPPSFYTMSHEQTSYQLLSFRYPPHPCFCTLGESKIRHCQNTAWFMAEHECCWNIYLDL